MDEIINIAEILTDADLALYPAQNGQPRESPDSSEYYIPDQTLMV